jgi:hypothetical protein
MGRGLESRPAVLRLRSLLFLGPQTYRNLNLKNTRGHIAAVCIVLLLLASSATAQDRRTLHGHVPEAVARLQPVGRLPGSTRLNLAIGLPLRNRQALTNLLQQIYDPRSPEYRHYLTTEQFTEMFGPTAQDYQALIRFVEANGFVVTGTHPNRVLLDVNGTVADIESAFHVTMRTYHHPTEARRFYAPDVEPSVASALPVLEISGLNNYIVPHPIKLKPTSLNGASKVTPSDGSGPGGTYMGTDFRAAYVPGVSLTGSSQTVGLVQFDGYYANDIVTYESQAGLPNVTLMNVLLDGFDGIPDTKEDFIAEVSLDIEMTVSMAPGLSKVLVYETGPDGIPNDVLNRMATDNQASQLSCSWGWGGGPDGAADEIFQQMAAQGQSFFAACGDSDAFIGSTSEDFPADDPNITLVGGTTLATTGPGGSWVSETTWNWGGDIGSGGGISTSYPIPDWQQGVNMSINRGSTIMRNVPDVALIADNVYVIYDNGSTNAFGGTSCGTPLWAAFTALVNQQAVAHSRPAVGFLNPALYAIGEGSNYAADFHDITTGNNTSTSSPIEFYAVAGYDLCTGWGSPGGQNLITDLATSDPLEITPATGFAASGAVGGPFSGSSQSISLSNSGATLLNWSLINASPWLNVSPTSGTLPSGSEATINVSLNSAANTLAAGVYSVPVWFTDLTSGVAQTREFTLRVGQPLIQNAGFETGDFTGWMQSGMLQSALFTSLVDDGSVITPHSGSYAAALSEYISFGDLSQTVPTVGGQPYLLSFWLQSSDLGFGQIPNEFTVTWDGSAIFDQVNLGVLDWTNIQFIVAATGPNTVLQFGFRNDWSYFGLDDISLTPVAAPVIQTVTRTNNAIAFTWSTVPGLRYQVQYATKLTQPNWINLGSAITAANTTLSTSDVIGLKTQRFYRVVLMPPP